MNNLFIIWIMDSASLYRDWVQPSIFLVNNSQFLDQSDCVYQMLFCVINSQMSKDGPKVEDKSMNVLQHQKIIQDADAEQKNCFINTSLPNHAHSYRFQAPLMLEFSESNLNNDFAFLLKHNRKICSELSFLIDNWDIFRLQFEEEAYRFVKAFKYKIERIPVSHIFYGETIKLVGQLYKKIGHVQQSSQKDNRITDLLFGHFMQAELNKYNLLGMYLIAVQRQDGLKQIPLHHYIRKTPQFLDNPYWTDIFFVTQWWIDYRLDYGVLPEQVPLKKKQKMVEHHKIETGNSGNLFQVRFLYEGSNIYNSFNNQQKIGVCGRIRDLWTSKGELQFMRELTGLFNNGGGVIVWDCFQNCLKLQPLGEQLMEQNKLEIYSYMDQLLHKIQPKVTMGVHCLLQFVPIAYKPLSEQCWKGGKFKLSFKMGYYVCLLKIVNTDPTSIYLYSSPGITIKCYKELSWLKADSMLEENGSQKQDYIEIQTNRKKAKKQIMLNDSAFYEQTEADRLTMVKFVKKYLQSTSDLNKIHAPNEKLQWLSMLSNSIGQNPTCWQRIQTNMLLESYQSLQIAQQHKYNQGVGKYYFLPLNVVSINSFLYKQCLPKYSKRYEVIYTKKAKVKQITKLHQDKVQNNLLLSKMQNEQSISGFVAQKMQLTLNIEQQLRTTIYTIHADIYHVEQILRWHINIDNSEQQTSQHLQEQTVECQSLCAILYFLRDRLHNCVEQMNQLNCQYYRQSVRKHREIGNRHYELNRMRVEIYQQSQLIQSHCKKIIAFDRDQVQKNEFLQKMISILTRMLQQHRECFRHTLCEIQTIALAKLYLSHFLSQLKEVKNYKCECYNNDKGEKCLKNKYLQALQNLITISQQIQLQVTKNQQQLINQDIWDTELAQKTEQFTRNIRNTDFKQITTNNLGSQNCLFGNKISIINEQAVEKVFESITTILNNLKHMVLISFQKIFGITPVMEQFIPKFNIFSQQADFLDQFISSIRHIWPEHFCLQHMPKQISPALIGTPIKSIKIAKVITNPEKDFAYASLLIAKASLLPKIKQNLIKYGYYCEIASFPDRYRHITDMINVLYHAELHSDIITLLRTKPEFKLNGRQLQVMAMTEYIKLTKRITRMSRQEFDNIAQWLRFEFQHESLKLIECQTQDWVQYYIQTESRKSTALIFAVLGRNSNFGVYSVMGQQSNECALINPQTSGVKLKVVYSSGKR